MTAPVVCARTTPLQCESWSEGKKIEGQGGDPFADLIKEGCYTADRYWKSVYYPALILPVCETGIKKGRKEAKNKEIK